MSVIDEGFSEKEEGQNVPYSHTKKEISTNPYSPAVPISPTFTY